MKNDPLLKNKKNYFLILQRSSNEQLLSLAAASTVQPLKETLSSKSDVQKNGPHRNVCYGN